MPRYSIAFCTSKPSLIHQLVSMETREAALLFFFKQFVGEDYSHDDEGFAYFRDDFFNAETPMGSVLEVEP
jgi:hypothetical protein